MEKDIAPSTAGLNQKPLEEVGEGRIGSDSKQEGPLGR